MIGQRTCKVCRESTPEILSTINRLLATGTRYRELEKLSGFSRSALWRHRHGCLSRKLLAQFRDKRTSMSKRRHVVCWPDGRIVLIRDVLRDPHGWRTPREISRSEISSNDVVIVVRYYDPKIKNPRALDFRTQGAQEAFRRDCAPGLQQEFVAYCHQQALIENENGTFRENVILGDYCVWPPVPETIDITDDSPEGDGTAL